MAARYPSMPCENQIVLAGRPTRHLGGRHNAIENFVHRAAVPKLMSERGCRCKHEAAANAARGVLPVSDSRSHGPRRRPRCCFHATGQPEETVPIYSRPLARSLETAGPTPTVDPAYIGKPCFCTPFARALHPARTTSEPASALSPKRKLAVGATI
jgi:hypothetical protein